MKNKAQHNPFDYRRIKVMIVLLALSLIMTSCAQEEPAKAVEKIRQVSVVTANEESYRETLKYTGYVTASQIIPIHFSIDGKVDEVKVKQGQKVKTGDILMTLEQMGTKVNPAGFAVAVMDGVVTQLINKPGDLVSKDYPVAIISTEKQVVKFGVTDTDLEKIEKFGNPVVSVELNGLKVDAVLEDVSKIPDQDSRLYNVTVALKEGKSQLIGTIGTISLELSRIYGIWLPIAQVQNDGEDYVYIVNADNRVERRNLRLKELYNDLVRVEGLNEGDRVITVGNAFVKEGQQVTAREEDHE